MTETDIIAALRNILPSGWRVEPANTCHVEVWCFNPGAGAMDEWAVAVSHSGQWRRSEPLGEWHAELSLWWDDGAYEEATWADTPEEALEFVREALPRLIAQTNRLAADLTDGAGTDLMVE